MLHLPRNIWLYNGRDDLHPDGSGLFAYGGLDW